MKDNKNDESTNKLLTLQEILDENTRIETITDKETLKSVIRKIIGVASYRKIRHEDMIEIMEEIYREYGVKH